MEEAGGDGISAQELGTEQRTVAAGPSPIWQSWVTWVPVMRQAETNYNGWEARITSARLNGWAQKTTVGGGRVCCRAVIGKDEPIGPSLKNP
ncbi:hypothetical protein N7466_007117 [Penicillium verhagenii]|uniref:uncharacterized protein n=1 Tax=Penicillium verhagenii TaxID=1562060 RepID=UPI002544DC8B|nr:uncharacterized protein N7466_007117 [Penicillium verhagenii]KAJ5928161.1 hypothetical protein N7466_007117 [Penicillium verhagenii]